MDFLLSILIPVAIFAAVSFVIGFLLAVAGKVFAVKKDERIDKITELLPGANCGACGYAGCANYAESMVTEGCEPDKCNACESGNLRLIAEILGKEIKLGEKSVARVLCSGSDDIAEKKYLYKGLSDCLSVAKLGNGPKLCSHGCIGLGTCVRVCPFDAISLENGVAVVDPAKCKACRVCVDTCPQHLIKILPAEKAAWVVCSSHLKGKDVRDICKAGCISCGICVRNCPAEAIEIKDNLAVIDFNKCIDCGLCAEKCPRKIIRHDKKTEDAPVTEIQ